LQVKAKIKFKPLNVLVVSLATLAMLSPFLAVCSLLWHQHLIYVAKSARLPTAARSDTAIELLLWAIFFAPLGFCLGISLYDRYRLHRAVERKKRVETLEKMWQQNIYSEEAMP
jgi:hypothetical protein